MRRILFCAMWLGMAGCGILDPGPVQRELEVAPYKVGCVGVGPRLCLQVRDSGASAWETLYETPVGFAFEWGVRQVIVVREEERDPVPADASSIVRHLERVVSKTSAAAGTRFDLGVPSPWLQSTSGTTLGVLGEPIQVACGDEGCVQILQAAESVPRILMTLELPGGPGEPLTLTEWRPCQAEGGPCAPPAVRR